jgi:hypothetical protein
MNRLEALLLDVRVNLGCCNISVAEEFLDDSEVSAILE